MSYTFDVLLDPDRADPGRAFLASIVLTPVDAFDGRIVTGPVVARIPRYGKVATRSLSGHLAFERLEAGRAYRVNIDPTRAGYFAPPDWDVPVPQPRGKPSEPRPQNDTRVIALVRLPDFVRDGEAMVLRGGVEDAARAPAAGVLLTAQVELFQDPNDRDPPEPAAPGVLGPTFTTLTNAKGNFAIRMRPPQVSPANMPRLPVTGTVTLDVGGVQVWVGQIRDLSTRVLPDPIRLP